VVEHFSRLFIHPREMMLAAETCECFCSLLPRLGSANKSVLSVAGRKWLGLARLSVQKLEVVPRAANTSIEATENEDRGRWTNSFHMRSDWQKKEYNTRSSWPLDHGRRFSTGATDYFCHVRFLWRWRAVVCTPFVFVNFAFSTFF